ncbi:MAG: hypothetical protein MJ160_07640 [Treponema sp.]|nr:hypothetical protein [Treponema sp.]
MKILVTGGGSEEPIDNVRAVCNFSTGKTSAFLADFLADEGNDVTELVSVRAVKASKARIVEYKTFAQLQQNLENECRTGNYDAVIHAAAVSDYSPFEVLVDGKSFAVGEFSKIPAGTELVVKMKKNPKLVDSIKQWGGSKTKLVAFKLTSNATLEQRKAAVDKVFAGNSDLNLKPDYVVSNDLSEITENKHPCKIFDLNGCVSQVSNLQELAAELQNLIKK